MKKLLPYLHLPLLAFLALPFPSPLHASETRVDSTGGLSLVMTDETVDINPFVLGNPAGLSLLPARNRFDAAFPWFQETPAGNPAGQVQAYGSLSRLADPFATSTLSESTLSSLAYQGFLLFPAGHWAFQASGDWLHATRQTDTVSGPGRSLERYRGMARTAYDFGPLSLGAQVELDQSDKDLPPRSALTNSSNGSGSDTAVNSTSGLLVNLQLDNGAKPAFLRAGGVLTAPLTEPQENDRYTAASGGNTAQVDFIARSPDFLSYGPGVYLDVPGRLQAAVIGRFQGEKGIVEVDSTNSSVFPGQAAFQAGTSSSSAVFGVLKAKLPLAGRAQQILSFNTGGYVTVVDSQSTVSGPGGTTLETSNNDNLEAGIGAGLENLDDFTVGLQAAMDSQAGNVNYLSGPAQPKSFFSYKVSLGGERWLTRQWAFRMGIDFEDDYNGGTQTVTKPYYVVAPGDRVVSTTLTAGVGYRDPGLTGDLMLWTGQPSLYDSSNPEDFATQAGVELALGLFL